MIPWIVLNRVSILQLDGKRVIKAHGLYAVRMSNIKSVLDIGDGIISMEVFSEDKIIYCKEDFREIIKILSTEGDYNNECQKRYGDALGNPR